MKKGVCLRVLRPLNQTPRFNRVSQTVFHYIFILGCVKRGDKKVFQKNQTDPLTINQI
jgi:hypothetical protein